MEWYIYPSLWPYFPSAILHFVLVEMRVVFAAAASWYMICKFMLLRIPDPEAYSESQKQEAFWITFCLFGVPCALLLLYELVGFVRHAGAPMSCGSGAYLGWTWRLERNRVYLGLVALMCIIPALTLCMAFHELHGHLKVGHVNNVDITNYVIPLGVMLVALIGLSGPQMRPNGWDQEQLDSLVFARSWIECFRSNDIFGLRLVDALWKAENGKPEELLTFLRSAEEVAVVMHVCREPREDVKQV
jgi:hypothetical protein